MINRMPVVFVGHGSPMNAIQINPFTQSLLDLGKSIPLPKSILCISAHWQTRNEWVTHMDSPKTIHDFYGFPKELNEVQYSAPGDPKLARYIQSQLNSVSLDDGEWGLDHGTWSVLKWMYPDANIPTVQFSIDLSKSFQTHLELGKKLNFLRDEGVLIVGSGNIVHNLSVMTWKKPSYAYDWASEFDGWVKAKLENRDDQSLASDALSSPAGQMSIPTPDHYVPFLYALGASNKNDKLKFVYEGIEYGSISMRSIIFEP